MRSGVVRSGSGAFGDDRDAAIVVDGLSKRYPTSSVTVFPPVVSVFDRDLNPFRRKDKPTDAEESSEPDAPPPRSRPPARGRAEDVDTYDLLDPELDDDEDDEDDEQLAEEGGRRTPWDPGEMFWALKDVSFRVHPGEALGVLGGPGSGKSTLLRILGGQAFPTEGRVLVRDPVSPVAEQLARGLSLSGSGTFDVELVLGSRLLGVDPHVVKQHRAEIEELSQPLTKPDGDPAPGATLRLAIASAVILPASVVLLDEPSRIEDAFMEQIVDLARERIRRGSALIFASRNTGLMAELCDEAIVLNEGSIVHRGDVTAVRADQVAQNGGGQSATRKRSAGGRTPPAVAQGGSLSQGGELHVPPVVAAFNASAALVSVEVQTATGTRSKRFLAADELSVEIRLETAVPDTEVHGGVCFTPRAGGTGFRLELSEPYRFGDPRAYVLAARVPPGTLPPGGYEVRADAFVSSGGEPGASVIARTADRIRIVGDEADAADPAEDPVECWDGRAAWRVEAQWSIE